MSVDSIHSPATNRDSRRSWRHGVLLYALMLLIARGVFILAAVDPAEERVVEVLAEGGFVWPSGPERTLYDREELYAGAAAEAIAQGIPIPLETYRFTAYGGGSLFVALLCAPLFTLFGPSVLALKLLGLLISVGGGIAWFAAVRRVFGTSAAWLFGALYLFGPSTFVRTSLIAKGDHSEAMALLGVVMYLIARASEARTRGRRVAAFSAGLCSGLGIWVTYSIVPTLVGLTLAIAVSTRLRPREIWGCAGVGFLIGLTPWAIDAVRLGVDAFQVYGRPLSEVLSWSEVGRRAQALINSGLFAGYDLPGGWAVRRIAALTWLAVCAGAIVSVARATGRRSTRTDDETNSRRVARLALLAGLAALFGSFILRAPDPSSRYLIPGYPLLLVALASAADAGWTRTRADWRRIVRERSFAAYLLAVTFGVAAQSATIVSSRWSASTRPLSGADWSLLGEVVGAKLSPDQIGKLSAGIAPNFWRGLGKRVHRFIAREQWVEAAALAGPDSLMVWDGIGMGWAEVGPHEETGAFARSMPASRRAAFVGGLTRHGEVLWLPLYARGGTPVIDRLLQSFSGADRSALERSCARTFAVVATHGARVGANRAAATSPQILSILTPDAAAYGAGFALFRASKRSPGDLLWRPPPDAWTRAYAQASQEPSGPARQGLLDAATRDAALDLPNGLILRRRVPGRPSSDRGN